MSATGGYFTAGSDSVSAARLNQKTVTVDTGAHIALLSTYYPGQLICATDNSSISFTAGVMYQRDPTNSFWTPLYPMGVHDHSSNSNPQTGGLLTNVFANNTGQFLYQTELLSPMASDFNWTVSTGSTVVNNIASNQWRVNLQTAATTGAWAQADFGGIKMDFGNPIKFQAKIEVEPNLNPVVSQLGRIGVNIEAASAAVNYSAKSIGFEFCDSSGVNYMLESCDGLGNNPASRSVITTGQPFAGVHAIKFLYTPTSLVGTVDQAVSVTKTDHLPVSGSADADKNMRFGISTPTNTTVKNMYVYGAVIVGNPNDVWYV